MQSMTTQEALGLEIDPSRIGTLELAGAQVPYVDLEDEPAVHTRLRVADALYVYERSFPIKGGSAVMPAAIAELQAKGKRVLVAERSHRYVVYVA
jgi:hypothetical protein